MEARRRWQARTSALRSLSQGDFPEGSATKHQALEQGPGGDPETRPGRGVAVSDADLEPTAQVRDRTAQGAVAAHKARRNDSHGRYAFGRHHPKRWLHHGRRPARTPGAAITTASRLTALWPRYGVRIPVAVRIMRLLGPWSAPSPFDSGPGSAGRPTRA